MTVAPDRADITGMSFLFTVALVGIGSAALFLTVVSIIERLH